MWVFYSGGRPRVRNEQLHHIKQTVFSSLFNKANSGTDLSAL